MPGMLEGRTGERYEDGDGQWIINKWPDPDDPATAGCLLAMLEGAGPRPYRRPGGLWVVATVPYMETYGHLSLPLGRACIAAAEALGRWPGGAE
jgi:GH24 family phage-related lysozyme (muramidase)